MIEFKKVQYVLDSVGREIARASLEYVDKDKTYSVLTALNRLGYLHWPLKEIIEYGQAKQCEHDYSGGNYSTCSKCGEIVI